MADTLSFISVISFVAATIFLIVAVIFWFVFKIPTVIGDLSGRNARKSIEQMRRSNEQSGAKSYKTGKKNEGRGKLTSTMHVIEKKDSEETEFLQESVVMDIDVLETAPLVEGEETELLVDENETAPLLDEEPMDTRPKPKVFIQLLDEITYTHTNEEI
jgi:Sec-independent protein translocase protein TatA